MSVQPSVQDAATDVDVAREASSLMRRHRRAQSKLERAFEKNDPVVLMVGEDNFELAHVIGTFVDGLDKRTMAVRLKQPQKDALAALGEINRVIGFDPMDLTLSDLQNVLTLFLEHQCRHSRRTVLCVEQADLQSMWLLDCIARLVKSTESTRIGRGLMVVLSGSTKLTSALRNPVFDTIRQRAGLPIRLAPFSIFETKAFLRQLSDSSGRGDLQGTFEFDAVEKLHRTSGGIPYKVARLYRECVAIVDKNGGRSATPKVVAAAARNLRTDLAIDRDSPTLKPALVAQSTRAARRLHIRCPEHPPRVLSLKAGRYMVGRAKTADIQLQSQCVSRRHALLIDTGDSVQILDLGGVNGTIVGTHRISEVTLTPGTVLTLGDCEIEYSVE